MKEVFAPHLNKNVRLGGRRRPVAMCPRMHLRKYLKDMPPPPPVCDYSGPAMAALANIYGNDQLGDCVIAGGYHVVGTETGNAGDLFTATETQIINDYSAIGGYVPGDPNSDQGCDEVTALNYWTQTGFANGTKLCGWVAVDPTDQTQVMQAMYLFENTFFAIELPDSWISPFPSSNGYIWDADTPDPNNGHCVVGVGYSQSGINIDSWGLIGTITWAAIAQLCTQAANGALYVLLSPDQVAKGMTKAPNGFDWSALIADFDSLGGNVPPGPVPVPVPPPQPAPPAPTPPDPPPAPTPPPDPIPPAAGPTLDQAIAWATQGLLENWPVDGAPPSK